LLLYLKNNPNFNSLARFLSIDLIKNKADYRYPKLLFPKVKRNKYDYSENSDQ
jgi:hypothetical protein